jgi:phosphatidylglycerophosphatase A
LLTNALSIKESSDELNPPVVTSALITPARRRRGARDYLALALATCGVGYMPLAPGTFGAVLGVGLYLLVRALTIRIVLSRVPAYPLTYEVAESLRVVFMLAVAFGVTLVGIWAAKRAESLLGRKDPGAVVIDEVAGQFIAFLFIPLEIKLRWWMILAGFLLFRLFDIWKPYPIRRLEALESGLGIMADDVLAGFYAAAALMLLLAAVSYINMISN